MPVKHVDSNVPVENVSYGLADAIYSVVSQYTDKFTHQTGSNVLTFEGDCHINFDNQVIGIKHGDTVYYNINSAWDPGYGPVTVTTIIGNTYCYILLLWTRWGDPRRCPLLFISNCGKKILGFGTGASYYDASGSLTFIDMKSKADTTYAYRSIIHARDALTIAEPNKLFANASLYSNLCGDYVIVDEIKSIYSVTTLSEPVINGKHYFAIGTQSIVEIE